MVRVDDLGPSLQVVNLADLDQLAGAAGQALDDVVLEGAQLVEIDLRLGEFDAPGLRMARFAEEIGHVKQRLGRNAAAIDADAAGIRFRIDQRDAEPEIGGQKGGGIAPGAGADDDELNGGHSELELITKSR